MLDVVRLHSTVALMISGAALFACKGAEPAQSGGPSSSAAHGAGGAATANSASAGPGAGGGAATSSTGSGGGFIGYTKVDGSGKALDRSADTVVAPDGTIYVSWVDGANAVHVAHSLDGATIAKAVTVKEAGVVPLVTMARHPRMAVDDKRIAIAVGEQSGNLHLYVADCVALDFGKSIAIGGEINTQFRDFPKPVFLGDGSVAVAWHGFASSGARLYLARESNGYQSEVASGGAPGKPCECCPLDVARAAAGDVVLAFRNDDNDDRDMWAATAPNAGAFSSWKAASNTEGIVPQCPMQGPRLLDAGAGKLAMVWSGRGGNTMGAVLISSGTPGGAWSGGAQVADFAGDEPTIALGKSGKIYVTAVTGQKRSAMVTSGDGGKSWSMPETLTTADGDLSTPQAGSNAGVAALGGVTAGGNVWLRRME